jgi:DNA-binding HxlR family transcriptional regulator
MLKRSYEGMDCSIARALEIVGERWTLLIIRDAARGLRRFDELQTSLGIARNVLATRLARLVEEGLLEQVRYSDKPERYEYRLTDKGRELRLALSALRQWGDKHLTKRPPGTLRRKSTKEPVIAAYVEKGDRTVDPEDVEWVDGPRRRSTRTPTLAGRGARSSSGVPQ